MIRLRLTGLVTIWMLFSAYNVAADEMPVQSEAAFSKVDSSTGEHCSGWTVELWRVGNHYLGEIHHHRGLCGDPPMGLLENIHYDRESGQLSFKSKISDGVDGRGNPTCDALDFQGTVDEKHLHGIMEWRGQFRETIDLLRGANSTGTYPSEKEWLDARKDVLKFRGPKCK